MDRFKKNLIILALGTGLTFFPQSLPEAAMKRGEPIPTFNLTSIRGKPFSNQDFSGSKPGVITLFKTNKCAPCIKSMEQLREIQKSLGNDLLIVAIGKEDKKTLQPFAAGLGLQFPLLTGNKRLFRSFSASLLPTTILVGPDGVILKVIQGSGKYIPKMLNSLAEMQLQRNKPQAAQLLYHKASQGGGGVAAQAGAAYSQLQAGKTQTAEKNFRKMAGSRDPEQRLHGKEGLAEILFQRGEQKKALAMASEVLTQAPNRVMANLVKGKALYAKGNKRAASKALLLAANKSNEADFVWQKADANVALGNLQMKEQKRSIALTSFQTAAAANPYSAEALSNQGVVLQKMGKPEKAVKIFKQMRKTHPNDQLAQGLLRRHST